MPQSKLSLEPKSGLSDLPTILAYPKILPLDAVPEIKDHLIYIIRSYDEDGLGVMVKRESSNDDLWVRIGDWDGNPISLDASDHHPFFPAASYLVQNELGKIIEVMRYAGIDQAQYYFSLEEEDMLLTDIRLSLNKFCGPGIIRDLFGKVTRTQEVIKIEPLTEKVLGLIREDRGSYSGDLIIKCSVFQTIVRDNELLPAYAKVKRI